VVASGVRARVGRGMYVQIHRKEQNGAEAGPGWGVRGHAEAAFHTTRNRWLALHLHMCGGQRRQVRFHYKSNTLQAQNKAGCIGSGLAGGTKSAKARWRERSESLG